MAFVDEQIVLKSYLDQMENDNLKIRLRCIDKVLDNNNIYCMEIGKKYANIIINGVEQNIPKYLRSKIFYTKDEYAML